MKHPLHHQQPKDHSDDPTPHALWEAISQGIFPKVVICVTYFAIAYSFAYALGSALYGASQ